MQNFDLALKYVLVDEGGNDDDPRDHGGRTSRGITQHEYDTRFSGDVWKASDDQIKSIYHDQYWLPYCDDLPNGLDYIFFDMAVNAGRSRAVKIFQQALGVGTDGMMGILTLDAIKKADPVKLIHDVSEARRNFYRNLAQFPIYGKGWLRRVDHCEQGAAAMVSSDEYIKHPNVESPKANEKDVSTTTVSPEASGSTTVAAGGLASIIDSLNDTLTKYQDLLHYAKYALLAIAVGTLGYSIWGFYRRSKIQKVVQ